MRTVRLLSAAALAVGIAACDATRSTSTDPELVEGARLSLTGTSQISIPTLDGHVISSIAHQWAVDGIVSKGIAEGARLKSAPAPMPLLVISDGHSLAGRDQPNQRRLISAKAKNGNAEDFVVVNSDAGPVKSIVHLENQQIVEAYSFGWSRTKGGWIATSFDVTVFRNGKPIARIGSTTKSAPGGPSSMRVADDVCMFDASAMCGGTPVLQGGGTGSGGGGTGCDCSRELTDYLMAAAAASAATNAAVSALPVITVAAVAGVMASGVIAVLWGTAAVFLYRYNSCVRSCQTVSSAPIEFPSGWVLASSEDRYYALAA
jgi:hypothetical protein